MKFRLHRSGMTGEEERRATEELRTSLRNEGLAEHPPLAPAIRARMLAATNGRLDAATSARALSLSWAARVAIPGVVAIIAFFTALHYYQTPGGPQEPAFLSLLTELPESALDSLLAARAPVESSTVIAPGSDLFALTREAAEEYLLASDRTPIVLETLSDEELSLLVHELRGSSPTAL